MLKKFAILGFILLLVGALVTTWLLNQKEPEINNAGDTAITNAVITEPNRYLEHIKKLKQSPSQHRDSMLKADVDKLAFGNDKPGPVADIIYGDNWSKKVESYRHKKEAREIFLTISIVIGACGAAIFGWCILLTITRTAARLFRYTFSHIGRKTTAAEEIEDNLPEKSDVSIISDASEADAENKQQPKQKREKISSHRGKIQKRERIFDALGLQDVTPDDINTIYAPSQKAVSMKRQTTADDANTQPETADRQQIESNKTDTSDFVGTDTADLLSSCSALTEQPEDIPFENNSTADNNIPAKNVSTASAGNVSQANEDSPQNNTPAQGSQKNVDLTLRELTEQISAIRNYAMTQQNRMEKLQDGYDWNIIRTFCLRIIRCIDNIEDRIEKLQNNSVDTQELDLIRDELLFALESSGVEQFKPETDSSYRGQEKLAEAVKERQFCDDPDKKGKIACVIKSGYKCFIDDENFKVIRPARVRLYDYQKQLSEQIDNTVKEEACRCPI